MTSLPRQRIYDRVITWSRRLGAVLSAVRVRQLARWGVARSGATNLDERLMSRGPPTAPWACCDRGMSPGPLYCQGGLVPANRCAGQSC